MKGLIYVLGICSLLSLLLGVMCKYSAYPHVIAGVGPKGYAGFTVILLLLSVNVALLELLKKK